MHWWVGSKSIFITSSPRCSSYTQAWEPLSKKRTGIHHEKENSIQSSQVLNVGGAVGAGPGVSQCYEFFTLNQVDVWGHGNSQVPTVSEGLMREDEEVWTGRASATCFWQRSPTRHPLLCSPNLQQLLKPTQHTLGQIYIPYISSRSEKNSRQSNHWIQFYQKILPENLKQTNKLHTCRESKKLSRYDFPLC